MEEIKFAQNELKLLIGFINHAIRQGGLQLGDVNAILPTVQKLQDKIKPDEKEKGGEPQGKKDN